jgi:hypothetical protein
MAEPASCPRESIFLMHFSKHLEGRIEKTRFCINSREEDTTSPSKTLRY